MNKQDWESLCNGCGKCCEVEPGVACPRLANDKSCTAYETRTTVERCVTITPANIPDLHRIGVLPDTCGYVRWSLGLPVLDEVPEYPLMPFVVASIGIQKKYFRSRDEMLAFRVIIYKTEV